ncbi:MAG: hypothetical protein ACRD44_16085 [Bryobacteraceae bacterium]
MYAEHTAVVAVISGAQVQTFSAGIGVRGNAALVFSPFSLSFIAVKGDPPPPANVIALRRSE